MTWFKSSSEYRALDKIDEESLEFEWNIFAGINTLQLCNKIQELLSRLSVEPENVTGRIIYMPMFNDISSESKDNEKNTNQVLFSFLSIQEEVHQENVYFSDLDHK